MCQLDVNSNFILSLVCAYSNLHHSLELTKISDCCGVMEIISICP
jgi:hypothetical protein